MTLERLLQEDAAARAAALDPASSCIVRAPAGSGKTGLLIQRYLLLLATVDEPEEIVAITFTRKAAGEMRARVVQALEGAVQAAPVEEHARATWELARRAAARDAARGWQLKQHPARMRIQTIDSLNAELTRQMPILARFGAQPRVAEKPQPLYEEAARRTLRLLEEGEPSQAEAVAELARHLDNDLPRIHRLLTELLPRRDQWLSKTGLVLDRAALTAGLRREVETHLAQLRDALPADCRAELAAVASRAGAILRSQGSASPITGCAGIAALPGTDAAALPVWRGIAAMLLTQEGKWRVLDKRQGFPADEPGLKARGKELLRRFASQAELRPLLAAVPALPPAEYPETQWRALAALLHLLPVAVAELKLGFAERGEVDFTEIALAALRALGEDEAPTDLALALDYRIRHLLVDEFQDTSVNQFRLLEKLTAGWQADDGRTLFLVGDPAQSIYRFREAEVGLFLDAWEQGLGGIRLRPLSLHANFRSRRELVEWYNRTFAEIFPLHADVESGAVAYAESAPRRGSAEGAAVQLHPLFGEARAEEAGLICRLIAEARAKDPQASIAVLVRAKSHLAAAVRRLRRLGIRFQAVEVENLADQPVVQDLLALTRALQHPADRGAWLAVLRAPWCGLSLNELHALAGPGDALIPARLGTETGPATTRYRHTRDVLLRALAERGRGDLRSRVESVWLQLGGPAALAGAEALADAEAYLELLEELDEGGGLGSVAELTGRLAQLFARPDPEADGSLQLMTIHKAKGLEFDVVILPGLDGIPRGGQKELLLWQERPRAGGEVDLLLSPLNATGHDQDPVYEWIAGLQKEQGRLEAARLLYVAVTRARETLHLIGGARVVEREGTVAAGAPRSASLLGLMWPVVQAEYGAALARWKPQTAAETRAEAGSFTRLKAGWMPPAPPEAVQWAHSAVLAGTEEEREFKWVGDTLRHVGTVVHRLLQRMAADGARGWDGARVRTAAPALRQMLADAGVREAELEVALADVIEAAENTLADPRGRWLLSDEHTDARSEYALSVIRAGRLQTGVMDRSFVDAEGLRWIVDYKTSRHSGADVDAFLEQERQRYARQLEGYAELMAGLESRRVKVALYFPLLQRFLEWEPVHGREP